MSATSMDLHEVLQRYWGHDQFRQGQEDIILSALAGNDNLVVMATGSGKSVCYQILPAVTNRICIVISPLISLMQDQVAALQARGMSACFLGSAQRDGGIKAAAWRGEFLLMYMTPELATKSLEDIRQLHHNRGLCLVAVDEAHCITEWGHDFRAEYREMGALRAALPEVPFMACTATATPAVQSDIISSLRLKPSAKTWAFSFERTNLHLTVRRKSSPHTANFTELYGAKGKGGRVCSTIIYTLSKKDADNLGSTLQADGFKVGVYHAGHSDKARHQLHMDFLCDKIDVVVATCAFGMGIDKSNLRLVYHYGAPPSLESYYQQIGRAGRDGLQSRCVLLWSAGDWVMNDMIKGLGSLPPAARANYQVGSERMQSFCHSTKCRHAQVVNFFAPGAMADTAPCTGGCDSCDRRGAGDVASRDLSHDMGLLLAAVAGMRGNFGSGKPIKLLCGSNAKDMASWTGLKTANGESLHGAGKAHSAEWWKALLGMALDHGLVASVSRSCQNRTFTAITITPKGKAQLESKAALHLELSADLAKLEKPIAPPRPQPSSSTQNSECNAEEMRLLEELRILRMEVAQAAGVAPTHICSDFSLDCIARLRPDSPGGLRMTGGCSDAFVQQYGHVFVAAVLNFCDGSSLKAGAPWRKPSRKSGEWTKFRHSGDSKVAGGRNATTVPICGEVRATQRASFDRFAAGESVASIAANDRVKPVQGDTILGHLSDCLADGLPVDVERFVQEAQLTAETAHAISAALDANGSMGPVKRALPDAISYGQIKAVYALRHARKAWFRADDAMDAPACHVARDQLSTQSPPSQQLPPQSQLSPSQHPEGVQAAAARLWQAQKLQRSRVPLSDCQTDSPARVAPTVASGVFAGGGGNSDSDAECAAALDVCEDLCRQPSPTISRTTLDTQQPDRECSPAVEPTLAEWQQPPAGSAHPAVHSPPPSLDQQSAGIDANAQRFPQPPRLKVTGKVVSRRAPAGTAWRRTQRAATTRGGAGSHEAACPEAAGGQGAAELHSQSGAQNGVGHFNSNTGSQTSSQTASQTEPGEWAEEPALDRNSPAQPLPTPRQPMGSKRVCSEGALPLHHHPKRPVLADLGTSGNRLQGPDRRRSSCGSRSSHVGKPAGMPRQPSMSQPRGPSPQQQVGEEASCALLRQAITAFLQSSGTATCSQLSAIFGGNDGGARLQKVLQTMSEAGNVVRQGRGADENMIDLSAYPEDMFRIVE